MRLINTTTYELEEFFGVIPPYAILSHTWADGEVTFQEFLSLQTASAKPGFAKIRRACEQALSDKLQYCWVDTCCIDKSSSAELSGAINSMYAWYQNAAVCYAYLMDVESVDQISMSKWFTRGWTLQELLAPKTVVFYSAQWTNLGTKVELHDIITLRTGIEKDYIMNYSPTWEAAVAKRFSWMSKRVTTRVEDSAYCLLGIFEVHMPLLYGEGAQAFIRLQHEIIKQSHDQSIFCWSWKPSLVPPGWQSILAPSASVYEESGNLHPFRFADKKNLKAYSITNVGLSIALKVLRTEYARIVLAVFEVTTFETSSYNFLRSACIVLYEHTSGQIYRRLPLSEAPFLVYGKIERHQEDLIIHCGKHRLEDVHIYDEDPPSQISLLKAPNFGIFFIRADNIETREDLELFFATDHVFYWKFDGLLTFSFSASHDTEIGVAIFANPTLKKEGIALCLAVRKSVSDSGHTEHHSHCTFISYATSYIEALRDIRIRFSENSHGDQHANHVSHMILLDDTVVYSSENGAAKTLQLAYLSYQNEDLSNVFRRIHKKY